MVELWHEKYMEQIKTNKTFWRIAAFIIIGGFLSGSYIFLNDFEWIGSTELHSGMESIATLLAFIVGTLALVNYYSKKNSTILFIGTGFLGTAFLDGYHAVVTSSYFSHLMPSENISLIPWSWIASRSFLSLYLFFSILAWRRENKSTLAKPVSETVVYSTSIFLTIACFLFFTLTPLTPGYFSQLAFPRPEEYIPALFFTITLAGYLQKNNWKTDPFEFWLVLSLIVSVISQAVYMPFSAILFDIEFEVAHTLKIISYIFVLVGLFVNIYHIYQQAEEANRAKSDFLNIMSHELRTPLTVILGYTPLLANPRKLPATKNLLFALERKDISHEAITILLGNALDEYAKYVNKMDSSGKQLLTLINDMLDLSKIEANMMEIEPENVKVRQIFNNIERQFEKSVRDKGLELKVSSHNEEVFADERRLNQILINLIGNAIKFTEKGQIEIKSTANAEFIKFHVTDTGCGINKDSIKSVFDRFKQADTGTTRNIGGSGLGLAITKRLVELHGGKIKVTSKVNQGSSFSFTLPKSKEQN